MSKKTTNKTAIGNVPEYFTINEELTIASIDLVKSELDRLLENDKELIIKGDNLKNIDLTGIQLLYAVSRQALKKQKKVIFDISVKQDAAVLLLKAGFDLAKFKK